MARYTKDENGNLILTAGGTRTWIVTQAAHDRAVSAGTAPNNCLVAITDDYPTEDDDPKKVDISTASGVGSIDCYRSGKVITVSINTGSVSVNAGTTLATGLPVPANANAYFPLVNVSGTAAPKCASLDNNGVMKAYLAFTAYTVGCFSYIAKE